MNRRDFMGWVGISCMAGSLPVAIAACADGTSNVNETTSPAADQAPDQPDQDAPESTSSFTKIATVAELDAEGSVLNLDGDVPVIMVRDPDTDAIVAYDPTCPHKQCKVSWKPAENAMVCPCHDSKFALSDGSVLAGPADQPLVQLEFQESEGDILVNLS
ncbi:Rieske (2Fe-2S) iron-sulfur domain protein (plasmid) [Thalassoporum mexicanum PCC 7367]|uniref:QcrA and Rieske domain-containing protein n=1 Tax=Thalassoporum mexicanum TaxID=3457544 RepID=UPI00029F8AA5|nr:Rieske (2Fe-2S) protein [Pseudanabaena sp. PCC 7367]AFY72021.1 Rieske (2Fe-2S) iron-sulfur domain protein [Pseudanabaena sp. PCC 7367]